MVFIDANHCLENKRALERQHTGRASAPEPEGRGRYAQPVLRRPQILSCKPEKNGI